MKNKLKLIITNPFFQGSAILTIGSFFISFLNYIFNLLAGRLLGPQGYGEITTLFSYTIIFSIPFTVFSNLIIQKICSKEKNQFIFIKMLNDWFFIKIKRWSFLLILLILIIPFLPQLTNLSPLVSYSFIPLIIISLFSVLYTSILQALQFFLVFTLISVLAVLIKLSGVFFVYFGIDGVNTIIFFVLLSSLIMLLISYIFVKNKVLNIQVSEKLDKRLFKILTEKYTLITIFSVLGITFLNNIDIIFVKKFFSPIDAGLYSAWSLFAKIIFYIVGPLISITYIFFTSNKKSGQNKIIFLSFLIIFIIGIIIFITYSLFPKIVISIFFGNKFLLVGKNLGLAAFFGMFYAFIMLMNNFFLAKKSFASLITILIIPFYIVGLFLFKQNIQNIMKINVFFSFFIILIYLTVYFFINKKGFKLF